MRFNSIRKHKAKLLPVCAMVTLLGVVGCEGQGVGQTPATIKPSSIKSNSIGDKQSSNLTPPTFEANASDQLIPDYSVDIAGNNPHLKTIKIVNNEPNTMYAMVYQSYSGTNQYRIYVNGTKGIPGGCSGSDFSRCTANVAIPQVMWRAGQVYVSTQDLFADKTFGPDGGTYTIDNTNSINKGDYVYEKPGKPTNVLPDAPSQLLEYTFDIASDPNQDYVGYDISYVDNLYLPIAMEDQQGMAGGYLGTGMNLSNLDVQLRKYIDGQYTCGYFSDNPNDCIGWAFYYTPLQNNYLKLPGGYNYFAQTDTASAFNNSLKMSVARKTNANRTINTSPSHANVVPEAITKRWLRWVKQPTKGEFGPKLTPDEQSNLSIYANNCGTDDFCNKFADTVTKLWYKGYDRLVQIDPTQLESGATELVSHMIGYNFPVEFLNTPPVIFQGSNAYETSISYPNSIKSVLRGVPWPYYNYSEQTQWYPDPSGANPATQKYNLDPMVWFVHKKLGFAGYGFSIDDEISFVREPQLSVTNPKSGGVAGLTISIGGLQGIKNKKPYDSNHVEQIITGVNKAGAGPNWSTISDTLGVTNGCAMPGSCPLTFKTPTATDVVTLGTTINGTPGSVKFTILHSTDESGFPVINVESGSCSATSNLDQTNICSGIFQSAVQHWILSVGVPLPAGGGNGTGAYMLFFPKGWTSITSDNSTLTGQNKIDLKHLTDGGAANIDASNNFDLNLTDQTDNIIVNLTMGIDAVDKKLTKVISCTATKGGQQAQCNLGTFNINGDHNQNLSIADPNGAVTAGGGGGGGNNSYTVYFAPDWVSMSASGDGCTIAGNGIDVSNIGGIPGAATVKFNNTCNVTMTGKGGLVFNLNINKDSTPPVSCTYNGKQCINFNSSGQNINLATPSGMEPQ